MIVRVAVLVITVAALNTVENATVGWLNDRASCLRQVPTRKASNQRAHVLISFLRADAALHEREASLEGNARRARWDRQVAAEWQADAAQVTFNRIPRCNKLLPDE